MLVRGAGAGRGESGWNLNWLFAHNLTLNYEAAPKYKYMFGAHRLLCLICET